MAKYVFDPNNDDGIKYPLDSVDPQGVPERLPPTPDFNTPTAPAKSQFATGRGCPQCAGDLKLFEYVKADDLVIVQCKKCLRKYHAPDLEQDELWKIIPKDYILRHMNGIDRKRVLRERQEGGG